jgi:hypothetical protein
MKLGCVKIYRPRILISVPILYDLSDEINDLWHILRNSGDDVWKSDVQSFTVIQKFCLKMTTKILELDFPIVGTIDDLIVNVCDVHAQVDVVSEIVCHESSEDIGADVCLSMAKMGVVVHRGATHIPVDLIRISWDKKLLFIAKGVHHF